MGQTVSNTNHEKQQLDPRIIASLREAAGAYDIDYNKLNIVCDDKLESTGSALIKTIKICQKDLLVRPELIDFVTYHEMAHIADSHVIKKLISISFHSICLCGLGYVATAVHKYRLRIPFFCRCVTYCGLLKLALCIPSSILSMVKQCEHRANEMACKKLISAKKFDTINMYLTYLEQCKINGIIRTTQTHPTVNSEYEHICKILKENGYNVGYEAKYKHRIFNSNDDIISSIYAENKTKPFKEQKN